MKNVHDYFHISKNRVVFRLQKMLKYKNHVSKFSFVDSLLNQNIGLEVLEWPIRTIKAWELIENLNLNNSIRIADFGCGRQLLRSQLPANCEYIPFDYLPRSTDTIVCDFNYEFPEGNFDVIFCLGVLEYLNHPFELLRHISLHSKFFVFSYNGPTNSERRKLQGWVNDFQFSEIGEFLKVSKIEILNSTALQDNEFIYLCLGLL